MGHILWNIKQLTDTIDQAIKNKFDFIGVFDGRRGLGKSTLAIKVALRFPIFNMKKHVLFKREEIMEALANNQNKVFVLDEMINVTHNRDFYAEDQKKLIKMLNMYRDSGNVILACVPNFAHLDNQFRDLMKMRVHIERRGLGVIHTPNQTAYSKDKWDMAVNEKIETRWIKKGIYKPNYKRLTTYRGLIHFNQLTPKQQELYDKIKFERRNQVYLDETDAPTESPYTRIFQLIKERKITKNQIQGIALANGWKYTNLITALHHKARDEGIKLRDLFETDGETESKVSNISSKNKMILPPISLNKTNSD